MLSLLLGSGAYATTKPADSLSQRLTACTACHGQQGKATAEGYFPRIAGKPAGYLYAQLLYFRDGQRPNTMMRYMLQGLSNDYLKEIAQYFSELDLPYPPASPLTLSTAEQARATQLIYHGDPQKHLPACVQCHGTHLMGRAPYIPSLLGLPRHYLSAQLNSWSQKLRHTPAPDCMATIANTLSGDDISVVAAWLASRPPVDSTAASKTSDIALPDPHCGRPKP